jgi:predicted porin
MKKTIVAAAVAAVFAAPAMADVKISGQINQEFRDSGADWVSGNNVDVIVSGSEDLGNGMKATFKIHRFYDDQGNTITVTNTTGETHSDNNEGTAADQTIGLSGDFGAITVGRFEPYTVQSITSMMNIDASEDLDLETSFGQGRTEGGFRYETPNMNGLTVGVEGFADGGSTGDNFATTTVYAQYSNAGLTVRAANESDRQGAAASNDVQSVGVSYKMGDIELRVVHTDDDNGAAADVANTFYGAKYTMGANTIAVGANSHDTANSDDQIISFSHALSKQTSVYLVHESIDAVNGKDNTLVGVKHSF